MQGQVLTRLCEGALATEGRLSRSKQSILKNKTHPFRRGVSFWIWPEVGVVGNGLKPFRTTGGPRSVRVVVAIGNDVPAGVFANRKQEGAGRALLGTEIISDLRTGVVYTNTAVLNPDEICGRA